MFAALRTLMAGSDRTQELPPSPFRCMTRVAVLAMELIFLMLVMVIDYELM